ncbi:MAG TPA: hypothetical protein VF950_05975 [Planctomycetota bacterium]
MRLLVCALLLGGADDGLKNVRVVGARHVHYADHAKGIRPLNAMEAGLTLSILAELPRPALGVKDGKLLRATSDAGEDLLPKKDWDRRLGFPALSEDRGSVVFDVTLRPPGPQAKGFAEISGAFTYTAGDKTEERDLGLGDWSAGSKGKELGAEIEQLREEAFDKSHVLGLTLKTPRESVAGVDFYDAEGKRIEVRPAGYMATGGMVTLNFASKAKFPPKGRIVARMYADLKSFEATFTLKDLDLLGRPAKK